MVVVIFIPESVTAFLDKEEKIDINKVVIEVPVDLQTDSKDEPSLDDLKPEGDKESEEKPEAALEAFKPAPEKKP